VMLSGYLSPNIATESIITVLHEVNAIAQRISLAKEMKEKLHEYILSLINKIVHGQEIYRKLFLNKELAIMQKLYTPRNVMEYKVTYKEIMVKTHTHIATLQFYPTKDYLDLFKGTASDDCIGVSLGEQHLRTPTFFNIRIFRDSKWIGNIYMLDFTEENGTLLVDRIQIPRGTNAYYIHFFRDLENIFEEIFVDVDYKEILLPLAISNHAAVQTVFNRYKEKLSTKKWHVNISQAAHFNSLSPNQNYYVLCEKI